MQGQLMKRKRFINQHAEEPFINTLPVLSA